MYSWPGGREQQQCLPLLIIAKSKVKAQGAYTTKHTHLHFRVNRALALFFIEGGGGARPPARPPHLSWESTTINGFPPSGPKA